MIKVKDLTPEIYYKQSRDFQFIGRLYELVLNSVKTNVDTIYNVPLSDNSNKKLIDLSALTLGFKLKHNYNSVQLYAICRAFSEIMRNKGTKKAIQLAGDTLTNAEGLTEKFEIYTDPNDQFNIKIIIPSGLSDVTLFRDLLDYILPAGMTCKITQHSNTPLISTTNSTQTSTSFARNYSADKLDSGYDGSNSDKLSDRYSVLFGVDDPSTTTKTEHTLIPGVIANSIVGIKLPPQEE